MIETVPLAFSGQRIFDVKKMLFEKIPGLETINYIYVVDKKRKLLGIFSIKEIFRRSEETVVEEIMEKEIIKVRPHTDQERVAILALKNNLKAIPVVDREGKFLGIVPSDIILNILHSENVEDFLKAAGIHSPLQKVLKGSPLFLAKIRLPWLILGLLGGILAAYIIDFFEAPLKSHFVLAAFIPLMLYLASAAGTQTETLFIRSLVLNSRIDIKKYLFREIKTAFLIALGLGILLSLISVFWFNSPYFIGIILGTSLFFTVLAAILVGIFVPWVLQEFKKDPAIGTGPFATIIRDILSLVIYFVIALFLLRVFL